MNGNGVDDVLARYGITHATVRVVSRLDCDVYRITPMAFARGAAVPRTGDLALRVYPESKQDLSAIDTELEWLRASADAALHVPRPLPDRHGDHVQWVRLPHSLAPRRAVLLTWLAGRMHDKGLNATRLARIGALTAALHNTSQAMADAGRVRTHRPAFSADLAGWASGQRPVSPHFPRNRHRVAMALAAQLVEEIASFPASGACHGLVHADLHPWNILFVKGAAGAIDFSDCGWGHHALDLATTLQFLKHPLAGNHDHRKIYPQLRQSLMTGYAAVRPLPADVDRQIDTFIAARMLLTLEWILDDWPRPDLRAWGPVFLSRCTAVFANHLS